MSERLEKRKRLISSRKTNNKREREFINAVRLHESGFPLSSKQLQQHIKNLTNVMVPLRILEFGSNKQDEQLSEIAEIVDHNKLPQTEYTSDHTKWRDKVLLSKRIKKSHTTIE